MHFIQEGIIFSQKEKKKKHSYPTNFIDCQTTFIDSESDLLDYQG